jgi:hypothetical protein
MPAPSDTTALQALRARNRLIQAVRSMLKGSSLDIRELTTHLVISSPGKPDYGRIYINFANGDASLRRCTWDYLGHLDHLDGHGSIDPDAEPPLTAQQIIAILTGQADRPGTGE